MPMFGRSRVAWKLSGLFSAIIVLVLAGTAYLNNLDDRREALEDARAFSKLHSQTVIQSLHRFMMTHDMDGMQQLIARLAKDNPVYEDIQLVSHQGKRRIVASFGGEDRSELDQKQWPCNICHLAGSEPFTASELSLDRIVDGDGGVRTLSIVTPIKNELVCSSASCHVHPEQDSLLGYVRADYSLQRMDALVARHKSKTALGVLVAVLLCTVASWVAIQRLVGTRIQTLTEGIRRATNADFSFRFSEDGTDEFAELASSFNEMTGQLSSTLTKLKRTREYLEGIVENSADIIITVGPEGLIERFNTGAEKTLGYKREEVVGKRIEMLFSDPRERDAAIAQLGYTDNVVNYETHFLAKDGRIREVILTLSRLRKGDGTPIGTFGISKDVTREKRLQRQLLQSERMAALGQAITGIQHSMKNLLNVLKGGSYMVKTGLAKDDKELLTDGWEMVQEGIAHITEMSTSMLLYAKEQKLKTSWTDLVEMARRIETLSEARFKEKGVSLELELADKLPAVECDPEMIHLVVMDLLANARDACFWKDYAEGESAQVVLRLQPGPSSEYVVIEVGDNGIGMNEEVRSKIFTPFFSTKDKKGTGMGLAVAARVINSHGGKVGVKSQEGQGATFRILLPIHGPGLEKEESNVKTGLGS